MVAPIIAAGARVVVGRGAKARALRAAATSIHGNTGEKKRRIGTITAVFMVTLAVIIDLVQFLLNLTVFLALASLYLTFLAASIFGIWFALLGVSYFSGKKSGLKMIAAIGGLFTELVPFINALPATTVSVIAVILISKVEDRSS